jgi:hypothetical protein
MYRNVRVRQEDDLYVESAVQKGEDIDAKDLISTRFISCLSCQKSSEFGSGKERC